jgi:hypothetical protein
MHSTRQHAEHKWIGGRHCDDSGIGDRVDRDKLKAEPFGGARYRDYPVRAIDRRAQARIGYGKSPPVFAPHRSRIVIPLRLDMFEHPLEEARKPRPSLFHRSRVAVDDARPPVDRGEIAGNNEGFQHLLGPDVRPDGLWEVLGLNHKSPAERIHAGECEPEIGAEWHGGREVCAEAQTAGHAEDSRNRAV